MHTENLHAVTGFVKCAFLFVDTVVRQDIAVNDACVLPGGKKTCPRKWEPRPRRTTRTRGAV